MGTSIKINLAVSELPYVRGLPEDGVQPYHTGIMELNPFIADMDFQQAQAVQGIAADPAHIEVCFPTVHDPSLAPEGKHIMTIDVNSQPYHAARRASGTTSRRIEPTARSRQMAEHFPKLPDLIEHRQVVTPLDMERLMGLTGGHALHGDMAPDQLLFLRPVRGWADYRTPIRGLYLCGAGTHPGRRGHRGERTERGPRGVEGRRQARTQRFRPLTIGFGVTCSMDGRGRTAFRAIGLSRSSARWWSWSSSSGSSSAGRRVCRRSSPCGSVSPGS